MQKFKLMEGYAPLLGIRRTQIAIKRLKDLFESELAAALSLIRVSAPLFVPSDSGLNDNLSGVERPVKFDLGENGEQNEIVQSLAKWKRIALKKYGIKEERGIYCDMNAIRRDEITDYTHSIYVDQWDWEFVIDEESRTIDKLKSVVDKVYSAFLRTETVLCTEFMELSPMLPPHIFFISSQELEDMYPNLSPEKREYEIAKKHKAVFICGIGHKLKSGYPHDRRSPDYDDWSLNGDIIFYYPVLDCALELSSMGIRVNPQTLMQQLDISGKLGWATLPFQSELIAGKLPQTCGGGIGQSRLCMFFLRKAHVGEVQASVWPNEMRAECEKNNIFLL